MSLKDIRARLKTPFTVSKGATILFGFLVFILLAANIALIIQNRSLKSPIARVYAPLELQAGTVVPRLNGLDLNGREINVEYGNDSRKAVVLVFSPHCGFCTMNMPNWKRIVDGLDRRSYRIVAVSIVSDGVKDYINQYGLTDVPIIAEVDPKSRASYEMRSTPQTMIISPNGTVEKVWTGVIEPKDWSELGPSLGLALQAPVK